MYKCQRCNRVSDDGMNWYYTDKEIEKMIVLNAVCSFCIVEMVNLLNLLFWRKE